MYMTSNPGYYPSVIDLFKYSRLEMVKHRLVQMQYLSSITTITCLSFKFHNGILSPPKGSYKVKANKKRDIPLDADVAKLDIKVLKEKS